jgi:hypothetical protein
MNWQLCDFFEVGGRMLLNEEQELSLLRVRHKLVAMRINFMYETREEYEARKKGRQGDPWEPLLRLWRGLTKEQLKVLGC